MRLTWLLLLLLRLYLLLLLSPVILCTRVMTIKKHNSTSSIFNFYSTPAGTAPSCSSRGCCWCLTSTLLLVMARPTLLLTNIITIVVVVVSVGCRGFHCFLHGEQF